MSSGLRMSTENGPKMGSLRAARNSSAAFFCAPSYFSGATGGIRSEEEEIGATMPISITSKPRQTEITRSTVPKR